MCAGRYLNLIPIWILYFFINKKYGMEHEIGEGKRPPSIFSLEKWHHRDLKGPRAIMALRGGGRGGWGREIQKSSSSLPPHPFCPQNFVRLFEEKERERGGDKKACVCSSSVLCSVCILEEEKRSSYWKSSLLLPRLPWHHQDGRRLFQRPMAF